MAHARANSVVIGREGRVLAVRPGARVDRRSKRFDLGKAVAAGHAPHPVMGPYGYSTHLAVLPDANLRERTRTKNPAEAGCMSWPEPVRGGGHGALRQRLSARRPLPDP